MSHASLGAFNTAFGTRRGSVDPLRVFGDSQMALSAHMLWSEDPGDAASREVARQLLWEINDGDDRQALLMLNGYGPQLLGGRQAASGDAGTDWREQIGYPHVVFVLGALLTDRRGPTMERAMDTFAGLKRTFGIDPSFTPALKRVKAVFDVKSMQEVLPALANGKRREHLLH